MAYLLNPAGRIVEIDDPAQFDIFANTQGFQKPTEEQVRNYIEERNQKFESLSKPQSEVGKVYFATVSEGGKDGYSVASSALVRELNALGYKTETNYRGQEVAVLFHNPYSLFRLESKYRIIYTMFESTKIPHDWIEYLNSADMVLVPSKWCQDTFARSGVKTQIVPLGYDDTIFKPIKRENKRDSRKTFTFLHYNAFNIRKGFVETFRAFNKAFNKDEPVRMIFKTTVDHIPIPITKSQYPNIEVIKGKMSNKELLDICFQSDCFVFPSRGEGFGVTPLEAMATGMPAIVPNAHGISEYFNNRYMYEVKVKEMCAALYLRYKEKTDEETRNSYGEMYVCDVDDLAQKMRYVYEHQDEAIEMGMRASEYVKQWTIRNSAEKLKEMCEQVRTQEPKRKVSTNFLQLERIT